MKTIIENKFIILNNELTTKTAIFELIAEQLKNENLISDTEQLINDFEKREKIGPTGLENGIAIPHAQTKAIQTPKIVIIRCNNEITGFESVDPNNKVKLVLAIIVPENSESEHLEILKTVASNLLNKKLVDQLLSTNEKDDFHQLLVKEEVNNQSVETSKELILGITACATGIAHTYMAAQALENAATKLGYQVKIEKQGANGIEDEITIEDVKRAKAVIFAHDVALMNLSRFNNLPYIDVKVAKPLHDPEGTVKEAINSQNIYQAENSESVQTTSSNQTTKNQIIEAIMTGISYMIPVIVAGGLLIGIANLIALAIGGQQLVSNLGRAVTLFLNGDLKPDMIAYFEKFSWFQLNTIITIAYLNLAGGLILRFMYPIFAGYVAKSIGGKNALLPGFIGGVFAQGLHTIIFAHAKIPAGIMAPFVENSTIPAVPGGFLSAITLGLLAGYFVKFMNNRIKLNKNILPLKTMLIVPGLSALVIVMVNILIVEPLFASLNIAVQKLILQYNQSQYIYSSLIAAATAFDLGGPINKAAGTVAIGLNADNIFPLTPRVLSIVIPPIGIGLSTVIAKVIPKGKNAFNNEEKTLGTSSMILGVIGISEGAIPFMIKHPLIVIPINIVGSIIGSLIAIKLGAVQKLPLPAIWGWPLVEGVGAYLFGMLVGVLFIGFAHAIAMTHIANKESVTQ